MFDFFKKNLKKKYPHDPLTVHLPDWVKDPENYNKIETALLETLICNKGHSDPSEMSKCVRCTQNMAERRELMKRFGFQNVGQYLQWKKTMNVMMHELRDPIT